jgi:hypothetical protein
MLSVCSSWDPSVLFSATICQTTWIGSNINNLPISCVELRDRRRRRMTRKPIRPITNIKPSTPPTMAASVFELCLAVTVTVLLVEENEGTSEPTTCVAVIVKG